MIRHFVDTDLSNRLETVRMSKPSRRGRGKSKPLTVVGYPAEIEAGFGRKQH